MVKKTAEQSTPHSDEETGHQSEAAKALSEIDDAADLAAKALALDAVQSVPLTQASAEAASEIAAGGTVGVDGTVTTAERQPELPGAREERVQMFIKRANAQKKKGRELLLKDYVGALSLEKKVKINDVNIGASAERFVGMCDLFLYTLGKQGPSVLGGEETQALLEKFTEMVDDYVNEAKEGQAQADAALTHEQSTTLEDWVTPKYITAAFEMTINAKHRQTARILDGLTIWDAVVKAQSVLEWNGRLDSSIVAQSRQLERRRLSNIHRFAARSLVGLKRRTERSPAKRASNDSAAPVNQELAAA